jgi:hypothetical protein
MKSFFGFKLEEEEMRRKIHEVSEADASIILVFFTSLHSGRD